jgi:TetR/AcrR family macrolide resistance operon transcriptional repressor
MARPFTASDEDILSAAQSVLERRGTDAFSIAEVATEVGLSRAAIILRFTSTQALKIKVLSKMVDRFAEALDKLPQSASGDNLLHLAAFIGNHTGSREGSARFFTNFTANLDDRDLLRLETRRGDALSAAISKAMPKVAIAHDQAVLAFRAHLAGSIFSWLASSDSDAHHYLVVRTKEWLQLAGIAFSERLVAELTARPRLHLKANAQAARAKRVRIVKPPRARGR